MTFQLFTCLYSCFIYFSSIFIHLFEHFNVIALFKLYSCILLLLYTIIIIIGIICAQFVNNCLNLTMSCAYVVI